MKPGLIYVLYGSDRFTRDEQVRGLKRRMLDDPSGEFNLTELAGKEVGLDDVRAAADALPFLADRRLVIVEGLLGRLAGATRPAARRGRSAGSRAAARTDETGPSRELETFLAYLADVPPTTALVLVEEQIDAALVAGRIPAERAHVRAYERPRPVELARWIDRRVKHHRGTIEAAAARQLARLAPEDLGLLDNEICKLVTYAGDRAVTLADVELLSATPDVTIFGLLDALAAGERGGALVHLRSLFARGERPEAIVPQIAAALRRLIQARELLDQGQRGPELQRRLGVHPFLAEKTEQQARAYRIDQLEAALRLLLQTDRGIKTGEAEPELALELFVADLPRA
ncbi:MAG: DNA polymerase III subunit delta [Actinomycetota bacterium]|nr:DNA polymerase III subunit delta [Actinomycetota bacterium]